MHSIVRLSGVLFLMFTVSFLLPSKLVGQDRHFSQFYASPLTMNPAMTGAYDGKFRIAGIYRDQWRPALERPFTTLSTALDFRFKLPHVSQYKDAIGVGLIFYKDEVRNFDYTSNEINLSFAYHKALNFKNTQFISAALQGGIAQRNINFNNQTFQDQFNQKDGYTFPTAESFPGNNIAFADLSAGINYSWNYKKNSLLQVGGAIHHILEPNIAFFDEVSSEKSILYRRYQIHGAMIFPVSRKAYLSPRLHYIQQGPHMEINAGSNVRFLANDYTRIAIHTGAWASIVGDVDKSMALESATLFFGLEYNGMLLGMSYDAGISEINSLGYKRGAFEISLGYVGEYEDDVVQCPTF
ncbi:MAG: PorP/SprF family type IX secretion system membrane protein [Saprospiraceae bacterium]|nr:PorP/SprF family type IX secretion system membrane protein [Saprospiraceae bacterium]